jgi:hypothetical protein
MDELIDWQIRQADAVGFPVAFLSNVPPPEIEDPSFQQERGVFAFVACCAAEGSPAWLMMARIAMLKAMNHGKERVFSDRKEMHWSKRKLKRDQ